MDMQIYDIQYDEVIKSFYITVGATYDYSVKNFVPLINKLEFQRSPLRKSFYKRLEEDILSGCIMPNITLAINVENEMPQREELIESYVECHLSNAFVLDGIQRLNTMKRVAENSNFPKDRILYCNILVCNSMDRLLYRMITLNNGQRPMTARHQIEILASNIFDFDELPILAVTEKESKNQKKSDDRMNKDVLIKGYLAYISNSVNIDNQKIIESKMNELIADQIMESNIPQKKGEFKDVICYINEQIANEQLKNWFGVPNNFIGFTAAMNKVFYAVRHIEAQDMEEKISIFEEAFSALDVSKIKLGMARRRLVQNYFENFENLSDFSVSKLINYISQEI